MKHRSITHRIVGLLLWVGFCAQPTYGQPQFTADSLFQAGVEAYRQEHFAEAQKAFQQILQQGWYSSALHYNVANCYYQQGQLGAAILHYEKALQLHPGDEEIKHNLQLAQEKRIDQFEKLPEPLFKRAYQTFITWLSPSQWAWSSLGAAFILLLGLALYYFSSLRRAGLIAALTGLLALIIALSSAYLHHTYRKNHQPAIVMEPSVYVKSGPSPLAEDAFILHEGTKVHLSERYEDWVKLRLSDGKIGWARTENFAKI